MYGSCNNCGEVAKIIIIEETEEDHSYGHYGYQCHPYTAESEVTECCEHFDWTECDEPSDLDE